MNFKELVSSLLTETSASVPIVSFDEINDDSLRQLHDIFWKDPLRQPGLVLCTHRHRLEVCYGTPSLVGSVI